MGGFHLMDLPEKLKFRAILTQGGAFKAKVSQKDAYPRYYFVLNRNPEKDENLVLLTSTTQFEHHKFCDGGDDVHIPLSPQDYQEFTEHCLICCDRPMTLARKDVERKLMQQNYQILQPLPSDIVAKILRGIARSNVVPAKIKEFVLGQE
jgi:hypothetical protein